MKIEFFFEKLFIDSELADDICSDLNISRKEYSEYAKQLNNDRQSEIQKIRRIRNLYHNKKGLKDNMGSKIFCFPDFKSFYKWHQTQFETQSGKCYYCKTDETVIATLFKKNFQHRKRTKRGNHLEIERKDSSDNLYNSKNCVLACYFCNNDKSDIFDEREFMEYLKDRKGFLT